MIVAVSLVILLILAAAIQWLQPVLGVTALPQSDTAMNVGLLMIAAWLTGEVFNRIRLPRISGYLIIGALVGPHILNVIGKDQTESLDFISKLAVALIALTAGGEIKFNWLRSQLGRVTIITLIELVTVWLVVGVAVFIVEGYIPLIQDASLTLRVVLATLTGLVAAANSPAVVVAMINEHKAVSVLAKTTLAVTILKDMFMVVVFAATLAVCKGVTAEQTAISGDFLLAVGVQLIGSIVLGAVFGVAMAWYVHRVKGHLVIFVIGACMVFALIGDQKFDIAGQHVHLEALLMGLSAGVLMQNLWPRESEPLFEAIESMSLPVYCLFFALAGLKLDLAMLASFWPAVLALVAVRTAAVWGSVTLGASLTGLTGGARRRLWLGFVPQAGVALALTQLIENAFPDSASVNVESLLVGMIAVHEVVGPIGFRWALLRSEKEAKEEAQTADQPPAQDADSPLPNAPRT